jgi:hypothetical protein
MGTSCTVNSAYLLHLVTFDSILSLPIGLVYGNIKIIDLLNNSRYGTIEPWKDEGPGREP